MSVISIQSQVVYGHVGNSAAVFPMQMNGIKVMAVPTTLLSNRPRYPTVRGVAVESRRQPRNADLDILHRRHPYRLMHADRGEEGGRDTDSVACAIRDACSSAMYRHRDQRRAVEQQLQQRYKEEGQT